MHTAAGPWLSQGDVRGSADTRWSWQAPFLQGFLITAVKLGDAEASRRRTVLGPDLANGGQCLEEEVSAVFDAAAIFVVVLVRMRGTGLRRPASP